MIPLASSKTAAPVHVAVAVCDGGEGDQGRPDGGDGIGGDSGAQEGADQRRGSPVIRVHGPTDQLCHAAPILMVFVHFRRVEARWNGPKT